MKEKKAICCPKARTFNGIVLMQTATFVVQIQKLRHIVGIPCKTHPDILFCLFGHSQFQTVGGQMLLGSHSRGEGYGRESLNHKSLC